MDVSSLLYGFRPGSEYAARRKALALRSAQLAIERVDPSFDFERHVRAACADIVGNVFGGAATDAYYTTVLTIFRKYCPDLDAFAAAIFNSIVIEMNFQTRLMIDGVMGSHEVIVFGGNPDLFAFAMQNGNITLGIHPTDLPGNGPPAWAEDYPEIELQVNNICRVPTVIYADFLTEAARARVGAVLLSDENGEDFNIAERYSGISDKISKHTIYCLHDSAETILRAARDISEMYPSLSPRLRLYAIKAGAAYENRGILIFHGLDYLPDLTIHRGNYRDFYMLGDAPKDRSRADIDVISYYKGEAFSVDASPELEVARWEASPLAKPWLISSSAPLPEEGRIRISDDSKLCHTMVGLHDGMLISSQEPGLATYIHAASDGGIVMEYGDENSRVAASHMVRGMQRDAEGIMRGRFKMARTLHVDGDAMPLTFTPILHKWHSHFVIQCLPRVQTLRDLGSDARLIVADTLRAKQLEMLEILGYGEDRLVKVPEDNVMVRADRLLVHRAWQLTFTEYTTRIYQDIVDHFGVFGDGPRRRILISRESRKSWRNLLNYDTIRLLLIEKYDFEEISPENLTLEEEVRLYNQAEIVIGAEGAGLYGGTFASPGAIFLSICDEDYIMPILASLARQRGFHVGYIFGESLRADADLARRLPWGHSDFVIDPERVENAVKAAIWQIKTTH